MEHVPSIHYRQLQPALLNSDAAKPHHKLLWCQPCSWGIHRPLRPGDKLKKYTFRQELHNLPTSTQSDMFASMVTEQRKLATERDRDTSSSANLVDCRFGVSAFIIISKLQHHSLFQRIPTKPNPCLQPTFVNFVTQHKFFLFLST